MKLEKLTPQIKRWAIDLGFHSIGITNTDLAQYHDHFNQWLQKNFHATMLFMSQYQEKRLHPEKLLPETIRVISVSMNYWAPNSGNISQHAKGKDYHTLIRKRLQQLADHIIKITGPLVYRAFCDSAPVLEKPLAEKAGLGWIGKNTTLINKHYGSFSFLGELFINLPLPIDTPAENHCGNCRKCLEACPTGALTAPYQLDARKCISYLTIEHKGEIPGNLRSLIGNRVFGCDACQLCCPWNQDCIESKEPAFQPNRELNQTKLLALNNLTEQEFFKITKGSDIRRIGYERWKRNINGVTHYLTDK